MSLTDILKIGKEVCGDTQTFLYSILKIIDEDKINNLAGAEILM